MSKALTLQTLTHVSGITDLKETSKLERHVECSVRYWSNGVFNLNTGLSWDVCFHFHLLWWK